MTDLTQNPMAVDVAFRLNTAPEVLTREQANVFGRELAELLHKYKVPYFIGKIGLYEGVTSTSPTDYQDSQFGPLPGGYDGPQDQEPDFLL